MSDLRVSWENKLVPGVLSCPVVSVEQGAELIKGIDKELIEKARLEMRVGDEWVPWVDEGTGEDDPEVYLEMVKKFPDDDAYFNSGV
jgi:hypothetical protein